MNILVAILCLLSPLLAFADSSLSLTPPSSDYSVIFLGNIFGVVDGVLHGNGSQLMGKMFGVFNAAVLALGGIVVTYTLIVGTMNTSHEGQFLGQKWSSIWIPLRSTIGLALLIPKSSGYCLMQIFVMWLVVQGVGAADKIWNAALNYLNMGGVIIGAQSNANPTTSGSKSALETIATGASRILTGQVCMRGLQVALEDARKEYLTQKEAGGGPCLDSNTSTNASLKEFCGSSVPDFLSTVDVVAANNNANNSVLMPNFPDETSVYHSLNGVCGQIGWTKLDVTAQAESVAQSASDEDIDTLNQSRAIGIQQMYMDFTPVSTAMVSNDPQLNKDNNNDSSKAYSALAQNQYGVPKLNTTLLLCSEPADACTNWDAGPSDKTQVFIFTGLEFMNTVSDYNAIMAPVLNMQAQANNADGNSKYHEFVTSAESSGWIMAGSYFFNVVNLNGSAASHSSDIDADSGLTSTSAYSDIAHNLTDPFNKPGTGTYSILYTLFNHDVGYITKLNNLITGSSIDSTMTPNVSSTAHAGKDTTVSATTYGYINNASLIHLPGQPGLATPQFTFNLNMSPGTTILKIPKMHFGCGFKILFFCVGGKLGDLIWNTVIYQVFDVIITFFTNLFDMVVQQLLVAPLTTMMAILNEGVQLLSTSQAHPIIAMAYMGTSFVNYVIEMYFQIITISEVFMFGGGILMMMIFPFLAAWMGTMMAIGFIDAYYIPFLPYMIFTFGSIAWFMAVVEAMVAGPIVALGVTHPEGHDALGKAEQALMILINVFLRPSMMIIGYVAGIALCYVAVYILNAGFVNVMHFLMPSGSHSDASNVSAFTAPTSPTQSGTPYVSYASMFAGFFCLVTYTTIYLTLVEKCFTLIYTLPDNISRWLGGQAESYGKETAQWADATKKQLEETTKDSGKAAMDVSQEFGTKVASKLTGKSEEELNTKWKKDE